MTTNTKSKYASKPTQDLLRSYRQLERSMQSITEVSDWVRCQNALGDMHEELLSRGVRAEAA